MEITRSTIARLYNVERRTNRLATMHKYSNEQIRTKVLSDLFTDFAFPGGYPVIFLVLDGQNGCNGDVLCAYCARAEVIENRGTVASDIYSESPTEYCAGCNREIESAYGDPDAEDEPEEGAYEDEDTSVNLIATMTEDEIAGLYVYNG